MWSEYIEIFIDIYCTAVAKNILCVHCEATTCRVRKDVGFVRCGNLGVNSPN